MTTPRIQKQARMHARWGLQGDASATPASQNAGRQSLDFIDFHSRSAPDRKPYGPVGQLPSARCPRKAFEWTLRGWPVRDEGVYNNCVSFATIACLEYLLAHDGTAGPALSPQSLIHAIKSKTGPSGTCDPHPRIGYTYLRWAYDALMHVGVSTEAAFPYVGDVAAPPPPGVQTVKYPDLNIVYHDQLYKHQNNIDAAAAVRACLQVNRQPVAVCLPLFGDAAVTTRLPTNWTTDDAQHHGLIADPPWNADPQGKQVLGNHSVCMTGFIPHQPEPNGGYFIFRNCGGTRMLAHFAPSTLSGITAPRPGYGVISATYVRKYCLELLQLLP
jgi:hypothetical protein